MAYAYKILRVCWFPSKTGRAHQKATGHQILTFIGIDEDARRPIKMKISRCKRCTWWDNEF